jgi:hypothetical protein
VKSQFLFNEQVSRNSHWRRTRSEMNPANGNENSRGCDSPIHRSRAVVVDADRDASIGRSLRESRDETRDSSTHVYHIEHHQLSSRYAPPLHPPPMQATKALGTLKRYVRCSSRKNARYRMLAAGISTATAAPSRSTIMRERARVSCALSQRQLPSLSRSFRRKE